MAKRNDKKDLRIVVFSDTHGEEDRIDMPEGDVLVFCGDMAATGDIKDYARFAHFMYRMPHRHKIIVPGNHDWLFQMNFGMAERMFADAGCVVLHDRGMEIDGVKFWGTAWTPVFMNWAFMLPPEGLRKKFALIPDDTNVLVTHGPPRGVLDVNRKDEPCGSVELAERIARLPKLRLHAFGHIHGNAEREQRGGVLHVNGSVLGEDYDFSRQPAVVQLALPRRERER